MKWYSKKEFSHLQLYGYIFLTSIITQILTEIFDRYF